MRKIFLTKNDENQLKSYIFSGSREICSFLYFCGNLIANGKRIRIWQNKTIIGKSSDADICVKDLTISRIHCVIYRENDKYYLQDAHSTNGTACDGYALKADSMVELREKSIIMIGNIIMTFEKPSIKEEKQRKIVLQKEI